MCFHRPRDVKAYKAHVERELTERGIPKVALVQVRTKSGRLVGAMPVDWRNDQAIANTLRDLRHWHPNAKVADLSDVARVRTLAFNTTNYGMYGESYTIREEWLPKPTGKPEPYAFAKPDETWEDQLREADEYVKKNVRKAVAVPV